MVARVPRWTPLLALVGVLAFVAVAPAQQPRSDQDPGYSSSTGGSSGSTSGSRPGNDRDPAYVNDGRGPGIRLSVLKGSLSALVRTRRVRVRVSSDERSLVYLTVSAVGKKSKPKELGFTQAGRRTVTLKLPPAARRAMRGRRSVRVRVVAQAVDQGGNLSRRTGSRLLRRTLARR